MSLISHCFELFAVEAEGAVAFPVGGAAAAAVGFEFVI